MSNEVEIYRALLQTDYCLYTGYVNSGWQSTKFHRYLCNRVQDFIERPCNKPYEILVISTPPQHGKSVTITETLPSWYLGRYQENRVIEISYGSDFAERFGRRNRQKIKEYGSKVFGIGLADSPNLATNFELENHLGGMMSCGALSGVTGNKANLMIIDDPIKTREEADSQSRRQKLWEEWCDSYRSRLAPSGKVIIIMTRWHEEDLAGMIISNEPNVEVLNLPLEAEEHDLLGRKVGEALCPEIGKGKEWLDEFKKVMVTKEGSRTWNALYQGHPVSAEGNLLKREWWSYYHSADRPTMVDTIMSVDAAFKDGDDNDFVAIQVWGKVNANIYLIDLVKKHLDYPSTKREIIRLKSMYPEINAILIEDKANGSALITELRRSIMGIVAINPQGGKISRVNAVSGAIESGNVYLPDDKPFTNDFVDECASFPNGKHDDQVDAMSQGLNRLIYYHSEPIMERVTNSIERYFPSLKRKPKGGAVGKGDKLNVI